jgi:hypothetical protein
MDRVMTGSKRYLELMDMEPVFLNVSDPLDEPKGETSYSSSSVWEEKEASMAPAMVPRARRGGLPSRGHQAMAAVLSSVPSLIACVCSKYSLSVDVEVLSVYSPKNNASLVVF